MGAYEVLSHRGVTRLCHFTKLQSLTHILSSPEGILSTERIKKDELNQVDPIRADGMNDYVCCSIEYPNSWYLDKAKSRDTSTIFHEWAIVFIDLDVLKMREAKVSECNAAMGSGAFICDGTDENTEKLFDYIVPSFSYPRTEKMLLCCPTNAQSEIMVKDSIPLEYIKGIAVGDEESARLVYAMEKTLETRNIDIYIAPRVLNRDWRKDIQEGIRPEETKFRG